jgi:hypothetical protein
VPAAASARQPSLFGTGPDGVAGLNSAVRASISMMMVMPDFIATHLQLHLASTKMISALGLVKH